MPFGICHLACVTLPGLTASCAACSVRCECVCQGSPCTSCAVPSVVAPPSMRGSVGMARPGKLQLSPWVMDACVQCVFVHVSMSAMSALTPRPCAIYVGWLGPHLCDTFAYVTSLPPCSPVIYIHPHIYIRFKRPSMLSSTRVVSRAAPRMFLWFRRTALPGCIGTPQSPARYIRLALRKRRRDSRAQRRWNGLTTG